MSALLASWLAGAATGRADDAPVAVTDGARANGVPDHSEALPARTAGVVLITGGAADRQREIVGEVIEDAVLTAGWSLPPQPLTQSESDGVLACLDTEQPASCIPAPLRLSRVFVVAVEAGQADDGAPLIVLTGKALLFDPRFTAIRQQYCERCASNDLIAASAELAKLVLRDLVLVAGTTIADFRSDPVGAEIFLDGNRVGATNAKLNTYPGKHVVRFEKPGYLAETRELIAKDDQSVRVAVLLHPKPAAPLRSKLLSGALIGAGGALLGVAAAGIYYSTKGDSDDRYRYPRAKPIGIVSAVLGAGAASAGLYLLWKGTFQ
jgi:hypothetical protein